MRISKLWKKVLRVPRASTHRFIVYEAANVEKNQFSIFIACDSCDHRSDTLFMSLTDLVDTITAAKVLAARDGGKRPSTAESK